MAEKSELFCTLTDAELRERRSLVRATLLPRVSAWQPLADGLRIEFEAVDGMREQIDEFVELERGCCSFLDFAVRDADKLTLTITGPEEAAGVIGMFSKALGGANA